MTGGAVIVGYSGIHLAARRRTTPHAIHMLKLLVPLTGAVTYVAAGRTLTARAPLIVPADHLHAASCDGVSLCLLIEPELLHGRLRAWSRAAVPRALDGPLARRLAGLASEIAGAFECASATDHADMVVAAAELLLAAESPAPTLDARVRAAIADLDGVTRPPLPALAERAGLSRCYLAHLVKQELGVTLSRLVLFRRMVAATREVLAGTPLAASALQAGFSDQAHFSRTTRSMLGQPPSFIAATAFKTRRPRPAIVPG